MTAEQQELYDAHRVWALKIASRVADRSRLNAAEAEPLKNAALVGLIQAAQRFDPKRGLAFKTMAGMRICGAATDCIRDEGWQPRGSYKKDRWRPECWEGVTLKKCSLDAAVATRKNSDDGKALMGFLPLSDKGLAALEASEEVEWLLAGLKPMEQFVLRQYYLLDESMKAIAEALGLSESRVCQIHARAIANLKRANGVTSAAFGSGSRG